MTDAQHMAWMLDEYEAVAGAHHSGAITGKSVRLGGSFGRLQSSGYGLVYTLPEALKELSVEPGTTSASVQGFGKVAQYAVELYHQIGGTVTCVSSWDQNDGVAYAVRKDGGIDLDELRGTADRFGGIDKDKARAGGTTWREFLRSTLSTPK